VVERVHREGFICTPPPEAQLIMKVVAAEKSIQPDVEGKQAVGTWRYPMSKFD
jgi:hypothetical protein